MIIARLCCMIIARMCCMIIARLCCMIIARRHLAYGHIWTELHKLASGTAPASPQHQQVGSVA